MAVKAHKQDGEIVIFSSATQAFHYAEKRDDVTKISWVDRDTKESIIFKKCLPFGWTFEPQSVTNPNQGVLNV